MPALLLHFFPSCSPARFGSCSLGELGLQQPSPALALAFPTLAVTLAAKVSSEPGRSSTLEPEVKNKREEKNGLQARGRNQGNQALNVIKGLYLKALKQNTQAGEKRFSCQVSARAIGEIANPRRTEGLCLSTAAPRAGAVQVMGAGEGWAGGDLPWPEAGSQSGGRNSWELLSLRAEQPGSERLLKKTSRARGAGLERGAGGKRRRPGAGGHGPVASLLGS